GIGSDEQVGEDEAKLAVGLEADRAVVDAATDGEIIVVAEDLVVIGGLQRSAGGERVGPRAVDRPPRRGGAGVAAPRRARGRRVVVDKDWATRLRKACWKSIVLEAQGVEQRIGLIAAAALDLGSVAVDVGLLKLAHIEIALDDPVVGDVIAAIERK